MSTSNVNTMKAAPGIIAKLAAGMLEDKVQFSKSIDVAPESDYKGTNGYSAGDTIYVSKPARFIPGTSADITSVIQDVVEEKVALTLDTRYVVPIALTSAEIATDLALENWTKRVLDPAVSSIAQYVEKAFIQKATQATYNLVGTAGSPSFDTDTILSANQKIDEFACPDTNNRFALLSPLANRYAVNARKGLFNSVPEVASQYKSGYMGEADGFTFLRNNMTYTHTNGADVTGIAVESSVVAISNGMSTLGVDGVASGATIKKGTVFTISGVNAVHPVTKADLGYLQQFTVTADVTESAGNSVTLAISPSIYYTTTDPRQNVSAAPVDETGALTFVGAASTSYGQSLCFHKSAFRMVSVPLVLPGGTDMAAQATSDGGFTIRVIRDYEVLTDRLVMRLDFLGGLAAVRPEWACRVTA